MEGERGTERRDKDTHIAIQRVNTDLILTITKHSYIDIPLCGKHCERSIGSLIHMT